MRRLRSFLALPARDRALLLRAVVAVVGVRLALWVLPFARVRALATRTGRRPPGAPDPSPSEDQWIAWSVATAAASVPKATCQTQALATRILLQRAGCPGYLRIGVMREGPDLHAHAWVETFDGEVLIGDHDLERFTLLPALPGDGDAA